MATDWRNGAPGFPLNAPWASKGQIEWKIGSMMMDSSAFTITGGETSKLLREYVQKLLETQEGWMTRRELKQKDIVDIRPILDLKNIRDWEAPMPELNDEDRLYAVKDYYYAYIPCFSEGAYHINAHRYIYWRMADLDLEQHRMMLFLQDYIYYTDGCGWHPGVCGTVGWRFSDPVPEIKDAASEQRRMKAELGHGSNPGDVPDYLTMYKLLDLDKDLRWGHANKETWQKIILEYAKRAQGMARQKSGKDNLDSLAHMFTTYTLKTNRILEEHRKAARASRPVSKSEHEFYVREKKEALENQGPDAAKSIKERRVRTIGEITVTSRSMPKPGRRAMADYKKPAWKTRGHLRKLPSGKRVYVRESVHRRKALLTPETAGIAPEAPAPMTVRITDTETARGGTYEAKRRESENREDKA